MADDKLPPAGRYVSDPHHTSLTWRVRHLGLSNYTARFKDVGIALDFRPDDPRSSSVVATVASRSVETDFPSDLKDWNGELADDQRFLAAGRAPELKFVSTRVVMTGERAADVTGDLTLRGVSNPFMLAVTFNGHVPNFLETGKPGIGFSAQGRFSRSLWGFVFPPAAFVSDEVEVLVEAELGHAGDGATS